MRRFNEVPAGDFLCSNPDGSLVDEAALPARTARPAPVRGLAAKDAKARVLVDIAIVHARTSYTLADGERRNGRCADVWARRGGRWLAVSAHVTPRRPRPEERRFSPSSPTRAGPAASS